MMKIGLVTTTLLMIIVGCGAAYRPGDVVPMSRMGQYHAMRTNWHDVLGHHCPIFGVNREVLLPIPKPTGYTGADAYKISFQVGREKFLIPWLLVINRKSPELPMIDIHLRYSGADIHGVTAKVVNMPHHCGGALNFAKFPSFVMYKTLQCRDALYLHKFEALTTNTEIHEDIAKDFWDPESWPKRIVVRYFWEEKSEIDVSGGFYVLFGAGFLLTLVMAIYILQSSPEKFVRFMRDNVGESSLHAEVAKVE